MPYTINISPLIDLGGFYGRGFPPFSATTISLTAGVVGTALSTPAAPLTLNFTSSAMPPVGPSLTLVRDTGGPGDLFRSGLVGAFPPSPGALAVFTVATVPLPATLIAGLGAGFASVTAVPTAARILIGVLSGGLFIPLTFTFSPSITIATSGSSLSVSMTGTLVSREYFFFPVARAITFTCAITPAPSGDAGNPARILSLVASSAAMTGPPFFSGLLASSLAPLVASFLESAVNSLIASTAVAMLPAGFRLSPSSVLCARRVTVAPSGIALQLLLSDLFGPGLIRVPITQNFSIAIAPAPVPNKQHAYKVTVTNAATGAFVPDATVTLHNFTSNGIPANSTGKTNSNGEIVFDVTLHFRIVVSTGGETRWFGSPTLTVSKTNFITVTITLLEEFE